MRKSMDRTGRGLVCAPAALAWPATLSSAAGGCATARKGGAGADGRYRTAYVDVDADRNTCHSGRARLRIPAGSRISYARLYGTKNRADVVAYDGDRGSGPDRLVTESGRGSARQPAPRHALGPDSDVFGLRPARRSGGDRLTFRFSPHRPGYLLGALFVRTDTRR
ncbi:hypothetical protein ACGF4C_24745 [Streptomyces sp. NPDC048197]|uniref:hypothetical protein n=1 Tax=Streptomyces sp. NPDC048197 TaxID=3365511 RepID=UPI00372392C4